MFLQWMYLIPIIAALALCIRHRSLSQYMPLLIAGFAADLAMLIVNTVTTLMMRFSMEGQHQPFTPLWPNIYTVTSLLSLGSWALIACGLGFVLNDVRQKLQHLETTPQSGWNYAPNSQSNAQASLQNAYQQHREETHAFDFAFQPAPVSAPAVGSASNGVSLPASLPVEPAPAVAVRAVEPDVMLPLGSSRS